MQKTPLSVTCIGGSIVAKRYIKPSIDIQNFVVEDVITLSSDSLYVDLGEMGENVTQDELP